MVKIYSASKVKEKVETYIVFQRIGLLNLPSNKTMRINNNLKIKLLLSITFLVIFKSICAQNTDSNHFLKIEGPISHDSIEFYISLPPSYNNCAKSYAVLYYLHGMNANYASFRTKEIIEFFRKQAQLGALPDFILIFPDGKEGFWGDHYDGKTLLETNLIKEIIPSVDQKFRTNKKRFIMGWSAGAAGAIHFYTKNPELFCGGISLDGPNINWKEMLYFQADKTKQICNSDSVFFYENFSSFPWIERNSKFLIKDKKPNMLIVASLFKPYHTTFLSLLKKEDIPVSYFELNCEHDFSCVFSESQEKLVTFMSDILNIRK